MTVIDGEARHRAFLSRSARLSREHMDNGKGGPFGAVVVKDGVVIAEGWNEVTSSNDPTAHAEVLAIRRACGALGSFTLRGAIIYSSCEPCPMCLAAIYWARLDAVYYANDRAQAAAIGFDDSLLYDEIPKSPSDRILPAIHLPMSEAKDVFDDWLKKADRIAY